VQWWHTYGVEEDDDDAEMAAELAKAEFKIKAKFKLKKEHKARGGGGGGGSGGGSGGGCVKKEPIDHVKKEPIDHVKKEPIDQHVGGGGGGGGGGGAFIRDFPQRRLIRGGRYRSISTNQMQGRHDATDLPDDESGDVAIPPISSFTQRRSTT
jgi:hypothetical protein